MNRIKENLYFLILITAISFFLSCLSSSALAREIKIGLATTNEGITINSTEDSILLNLFNNQIVSKINKNDVLSIENKKGIIRIKNNNATLGAFTGPVQLIPTSRNAFVFFNNKKYRGKLTILCKSFPERITIINTVDLEDYLLSVVPSEMPYKWHKEALKAQSVAARTYAVGYLGRRKHKGYDLESTVEDQVYLGVDSEKDATSNAVIETKGQILTGKNNKPIIALFHSSGGGYTDSIENIWGEKDIKPSDHIQPRPDYDDNSPYFKWTRRLSLEEINTLLVNLNIGKIKEIIPLERSVSERVTKVKIVSNNCYKVINGDDFRRVLKLPSSKFNLIFENGTYLFAGRGNGHGLGLSQWGSKKLAENGFTFKQILSHYYPGTLLASFQDNH